MCDIHCAMQSTSRLYIALFIFNFLCEPRPTVAKYDLLKRTNNKMFLPFISISRIAHVLKSSPHDIPQNDNYCICTFLLHFSLYISKLSFNSTFQHFNEHWIRFNLFYEAFYLWLRCKFNESQLECRFVVVVSHVRLFIIDILRCISSSAFISILVMLIIIDVCI